MIAAWIGEYGVPYVDMFYDGWYVAWDSSCFTFKVFYQEVFVGEIQDKALFAPSGEMRMLASDLLIITELMMSIKKLEV